MWEFVTQDFFLGEGGRKLVTASGSDDGGGADEAVLVLVEAIGGGRFDADTGLSEAQLEASPGDGRVQAVCGEASSRGAIRVLVTARAAGWFRVTIARLRDLARSAWHSLPCENCKKLAGLLLKALLAWAGFGFPTGTGDVLDALAGFDMARFIAALKSSAIWLWVQRHGLDLLATALLPAVIGIYTYIRRIEDSVYEAACREIGLCPGP